jgi:hypothetical protein
MEENKALILLGQICPYCNCETELVEGNKIYPNRSYEEPRPTFLDKKYYVCIKNRQHYVGTYADNKTSLGRVADKELRSLKRQGHNCFDPLWKTKRHFKSQRLAYKWLSKKMNIPLEETHFGMFDIDQCKMAIGFCQNLK